MIPKPKHCDQEWLNMKKVPGGRLCGKCQHVMTDFTKMSWAEIEQFHHAAEGPACGMYSEKQLKYWGREVPSLFSSCSKAAVVLTSMFAALNFNQAEAKPIKISPEEVKLSVSEPATDSMPKPNLHEKCLRPEPHKIKGSLKDKETGEPLLFANIWLKGTKIGTTTDFDGFYELTLPESGEGPHTLVFSYVGYKTEEVIINSSHKDSLNLTLDHDLVLDDANIIFYGIRKPTLKEKVKAGCKKLFGREE